MNEFLDLVITLIIVASMGVTCLFLLILTDYKDEIWGCFYFESEDKKE